MFNHFSIIATCLDYLSPLSHPPMLDLTMDNITENVMQINSMCDNPRLRYLITELVKASHDYVRDVNLQFDEWEQAWQYLTRVSRASYYMHYLLLAIGEQAGQISTDVCHEFVLLSDILGISALVDAISNPAVSGATETSVLGPFHDEEAHSFEYANPSPQKARPVSQPSCTASYVTRMGKPYPKL